VNRRVLVPVTVSLILVAACGGSDAAESSTSAAAATAVAPGEEAPNSISDGVVDTTAAPPIVGDTVPPSDMITLPSSDFDICATVPSLEVINGVLDEPATRTVELARTPDTAICEASSDTGIANVQFSRSLFADRAVTEQVAAQLGSAVVDLNDPALPGAFSYSGAVVIIIDEVEYLVQAITLDTITNPESPEATQRSATLLKAWLANLGV
jgi:hypothetical protein